MENIPKTIYLQSKILENDTKFNLVFFVPGVSVYFYLKRRNSDKKRIQNIIAGMLCSS